MAILLNLVKKDGEASVRDERRLSILTALGVRTDVPPILSPSKHHYPANRGELFRGNEADSPNHVSSRSRENVSRLLAR